MKDVQFVLITGLSGAGKSNAVGSFEDLGYFCVDNLPPSFIPKFAEMCVQSEGKINKVALVSDIRGGEFFTNLFEALDQLEAMGLGYEILFLEADEEVLVRRYKETRRKHPLADGASILDSITKEKEMLSEIRGKADKVINTAQLTPAKLKERIFHLYASEKREKTLYITLISFGYKYSVPIDADLVFDVRFLPNPHYVEHLRALPGTDERVSKYLWKWPITHKFLIKLQDFLQFLLPHYLREGKSHLVIAIGCTGGKHRSVVISDTIARQLQEEGFCSNVEHRDLEKD